VINRTWYAEDECGNVSTCHQVITIVDTTPPSITCPPDMTLACDIDVPYVPATATDVCDADVTITYQDNIVEQECGVDVFVDNVDRVLYVIVRTHYAIDECGNTSSCTQHIVIRDDIAPQVECPPNVTIDCSASTDPDFTGWVIATDNCDPNPIPTYVDLYGGTECTPVITRVWSATDHCGNGLSANVCIQTITLVDTTPPSITCPEPITVECGTELPATEATAIDDCHNVTLTYSDSAPAGMCPMVVTRTHYATDECGNVSSCTQYIYLIDTTPPLVVCPDDVTLECNVDEIPTTLATATDACDPDVDVTYYDVEYPQDCANQVFIEGVDQVLAIIVRTHIATDDCGNQAACTQHIVIRDDTPPQVTCAPDITIQCDQDPDNLMLTGVPIVADLCDPNAYATIIITYPIYSSQCSTVLERIWLATDQCGNGNSGGLCTQHITIVDTTPPSITCGEPVTIECGDQLPLTEVIAKDNCNEVSVTW